MWEEGHTTDKSTSHTENSPPISTSPIPTFQRETQIHLEPHQNIHNITLKMSTTRNVDAVANQQPTGGSGEFHAKRDRDEPMTTHGVSHTSINGTPNTLQAQLTLSLNSTSPASTSATTPSPNSTPKSCLQAAPPPTQPSNPTPPRKSPRSPTTRPPHPQSAAQPPAT